MKRQRDEQQAINDDVRRRGRSNSDASMNDAKWKQQQQQDNDDNSNNNFNDLNKNDVEEEQENKKSQRRLQREQREISMKKSMRALKTFIPEFWDEREFQQWQADANRLRHNINHNHNNNIARGCHGDDNVARGCHGDDHHPSHDEKIKSSDTVLSKTTTTNAAATSLLDTKQKEEDKTTNQRQMEMHHWENSQKAVSNTSEESNARLKTSSTDDDDDDSTHDLPLSSGQGQESRTVRLDGEDNNNIHNSAVIPPTATTNISNFPLTPEAKILAEIWARAFVLYPSYKSGTERDAWVKHQIFNNSSSSGSSGAYLALRNRWREKARLPSFKRSGLVMLVKFKEKNRFRQYRDLVLSKLLSSQQSNSSAKQQQQKPDDDDGDAGHAEPQRELEKEQNLVAKISKNSATSSLSERSASRNEQPPAEAKTQKGDMIEEKSNQHPDYKANRPSAPVVESFDTERQHHHQRRNRQLHLVEVKNSSESFSTGHALNTHFPTPPAELSMESREFAIYWAKSFIRFPKIRAHNKRREEFVKNCVMEYGSMELKQRWVTQSRMPSFVRAGLGSVVSSKEREVFRIYRDTVRGHLLDYGYKMEEDWAVDDLEFDNCDGRACASPDDDENNSKKTMEEFSYKLNDIPSVPKNINLSLEAKQIAIFWAKAMMEIPDSTMTRQRMEIIRQLIYSEGSTKLQEKWASKPICALQKSGVGSLTSYKERESCRKYRNLVLSYWSKDDDDANMCQSTELSETMTQLASFWAKTLYTCPGGSEQDRINILTDLIFDKGSTELQHLWKTKSMLPKVKTKKNIVYNLVPVQDWVQFRLHRDDVLEQLILLKGKDNNRSHVPVENALPIQVAKEEDECVNAASTTITSSTVDTVLKSVLGGGKMEESIMSMDDIREVEVKNDGDCVTNAAADVASGLKSEESGFIINSASHVEVKVADNDCVTTITSAGGGDVWFADAVSGAKMKESKTPIEDAGQGEVKGDDDFETSGTTASTADGAFSKNTVGAKIQGFLATAGYLVPSVPSLHFPPAKHNQKKMATAARGSNKRSTKRSWLDEKSHKQSSVSTA